MINYIIINQLLIISHHQCTPQLSLLVNYNYYYYYIALIQLVNSTTNSNRIPPMPRHHRRTMHTRHQCYQTDTPPPTTNDESYSQPNYSHM